MKIAFFDTNPTGETLLVLWQKNMAMKSHSLMKD